MLMVSTSMVRLCLADLIDVARGEEGVRTPIEEEACRAIPPRAAPPSPARCDDSHRREGWHRGGLTQRRGPSGRRLTASQLQALSRQERSPRGRCRRERSRARDRHARGRQRGAVARRAARSDRARLCLLRPRAPCAIQVAEAPQRLPTSPTTPSCSLPTTPHSGFSSLPSKNARPEGSFAEAIP